MNMDETNNMQDIIPEIEEIKLDDFTETETEIVETPLSASELKINEKTKIKKPAGIAFRMLLLMLIFISLIFTSIFLSFNFFIEDYMRRDMISQLETAVKDISLNNNSIIFDYGTRFEINPFTGSYTVSHDPYSVYIAVTRYLRDKNENSEVNTIIYYDYTRYFPDSDADIFQNLDEMDNLMTAVKTNNLTEENKIYKTSIFSGNYYLINTDLGSLFGLTGFSAVFYVSTNKYDDLIQNIYFMLLAILIIAMIFTIAYVLFISRSISKPIQKLCSFADAIGHGNFKRNEYSFKDRELIDLNRRMNETAGKLEKSDDDQKTFFQNVSHELKTPLMSIKGYAEGIKYKVFESEKDMNNAMDIIISESDRLNELVADLLYISKIDASKSFSDSQNMTKENLLEIVENCAEKLRGLLINQEKIKDKKISIIHPQKDIYINCSEENLMRAIMNIIANCVQYAKTEVEVSFYENESKAVLYIKDDGPGIDEKDLPNIFKRFYKGKTGKHGIGLSITKSIIEQHNAKITARNRIDITGAEFIIEFDK